MQIKLIPLQSLPDEIKSLNYDHGFFAQSAWFELLDNHVFKSKQGFSAYLTGYNDLQQPAVLLPVRFQQSTWHPARFNSLTCFYTPLYHCLTLNSAQPITAITDFFASLKLGPIRWRQFILYAMPRETAQALCLQLKSIGIPAQGFFCFANWYLPVTYPNFDAYWATRNTQLRNTIKRKFLKFNKLAHSRIELYFTEEALAQAAAHYQEVYNDSWKQSEAYPEFMTDLMHLAARQNGLRLAIAYIGSEPIAAQFWIVADNTAYIYKLAYKEAHKALGAGSLLTSTLMQYVIDIDKVAVVDYLTGDDAYKQDWMTDRRERWGIEVFNTTTFLGFLLYTRETLKTLVKNRFDFRSLASRK
jgi:hypothetical protein